MSVCKARFHLLMHVLAGWLQHFRNGFLLSWIASSPSETRSAWTTGGLGRFPLKSTTRGYFVGVQVFLEDAGFDWKILGPDVSNEAYVAWQCDQDAYACTGQKCSATSLLFMHKNWADAGAPPLPLRAQSRGLRCNGRIRTCLLVLSTLA